MMSRWPAPCCLAIVLSTISGTASAHGPSAEVVYAIAGFYLLPMIIAVLVAPGGRRWIMAGLAVLSVAVGWVIMYFAFPTGDQANPALAALGYLLPWVLVVLAGVWRFRRRTI